MSARGSGRGCTPTSSDSGLRLARVENVRSNNRTDERDSVFIQLNSDNTARRATGSPYARKSITDITDFSDNGQDIHPKKVRERLGKEGARLTAFTTVNAGVSQKIDMMADEARATTVAERDRSMASLPRLE